MTALPETFGELLAGFSPEQITRMEVFADSAPERSPQQLRDLLRVFAGAGERFLASQSQQPEQRRSAA